MRSRRYIQFFLVASCILVCAKGRPQSIFTIAGGGTDDGRPATVAALTRPNCIAVDRSDNLYIADPDQHRIRRVDARSGIITTAAGIGADGFAGDGGPATKASFSWPRGIAFDRDGNLLIADSQNNRIREISALSGHVTTVAGSGRYGFSGDGGPATAATFAWPNRVTLDAFGNLYITDAFNNRIRKVDAQTGIVTTIAGNGERGFSGDGGPATAAALNFFGPPDISFPYVGWPSAVAIDRTRDLYIADTFNNRVRKVTVATGTITTIAGDGTRGFSGDGGVATKAQLDWPSGLAIDLAGDLLITDSNNSRIRKVAIASGVITTVVGGGPYAPGLGDGGPATAAKLLNPTDVALDGSANLYIADSTGSRIRRVVSGSGVITTVAGTGDNFFTGDEGPATAATLGDPEGVALHSGSLFIADVTADRVRKVALATGFITTVAGTGVRGSGGDEGPARSARLAQPRGVAVDAQGNLYIADELNSRIRKVAAGSEIITTVAGNGTEGFSGDGDPATTAALNRPFGVAVDVFGNLYVADTRNQRIRKVDGTTGIITTVAGNGTEGFSGDGGPATSASLYFPRDVTVDSSRALYIPDDLQCLIRKVDLSSGTIVTAVGNGGCGFSGDGGPATAAELGTPSGVSIDASGNLLIAANYRVRKVVTATGNISTVAGSGRPGFSGDGGPATSADLSLFLGLAVDASGNLYIADSDNSRVRVVYACLTVGPLALASPADGSLGVTTSPRLAWNAVRGAFRYDVYLGTINPPKQIVASDIATTIFAPANLEPLTIYHWQVVAKGDPFCIPFSTAASPIRTFTTAASCGAPGSFDGTSP